MISFLRFVCLNVLFLVDVGYDRLALGSGSATSICHLIPAHSNEINI